MLTAYAAGSTQQVPAGGGVEMIITTVLMIAVFYFLIIRPQKKRQRQMQNMLDALQKGDEIVTIGGIMGKVFDIRQDCVVITTSADDTKMKFEKTAIAKVLTVHEEETDDAGETKSKKLFGKKKDN